MSRPLNLAIGLLLLASSPMASRGQIPRRAAQPVAAQPPADRTLAALASAQQQSLQRADPIAVETATRPLSAYLLRQLAQLQLVEAKPTEAIELEHKSLALEDTPEGRLELASILLRTGQPKDAAAETLMALASQPESAVAWAIRGSALRAAGDDQGAVDAFNRSLKLQPSVNVAYALASSLLAVHEQAEAALIFKQITDGSGDSAIQHVAAGDAYLEARYLNEAVAEFKRALALDPRAPHAEFFLGFTYLQMNEWGPNSESFAHLRAAVQQTPHDYLSNFYLGAIESTDGTDIASSNRHLHVAAEADPKSPEVWLYLGLNAVREKDTSSAKLYLRKAITLTGTDEARNNYQIRRVYAVLGRILVSEGNHEEGDALLARYRSTEHSAIGNSTAVIVRAAGQDDARAALSGIPAAKVAFPGVSPDAPSAAGAASAPPLALPAVHETEQMRQAERQLSDLLAISLNDLGTAEARQGRYREALAHFKEAEHWQTPTPALLRNLGVAAFRVGDFAEADRALSTYVAKPQPNSSSPPDDRARIMLAMSQFSLGNFTAADKSFTAVSDASLLDSRANYSWAYSLAHSGRQQRANSLALQLQQQPLPSDQLSLVCHIFMDTESYDQSFACYQKAYTADPQLKMAHYQAAESLIRTNRPAEAIAELRKELSFQPQNPDVQYALAFALLQGSQRAEAASLLENLAVNHPGHAQAQYQLGKLLLEDGKTSDALTHLEAAERSDPRPDYIHYQLQAAYRKAGRVEDAERELAIYRDIKARNRDTSPAKAALHNTAPM